MLINYFKNIYTLEIDYENLVLNEEKDFLLLTITLLNIDLIFQKVNYIKLNLKNFQFQNDIYSRYFRLEKEILNNTNKYAKFSNYIENNKTDNDIKPDLMNENICIISNVFIELIYYK